MSEVISSAVLPRRKTLSQWNADHSIPRLGEVLIEVNTPMSFKIGDGRLEYSALPYPPGFSGTLTLQQVLTAGNTGTTPNNLIALDDGIYISDTSSYSYLVKTEAGLTLCLLGVYAGVPIFQLATSDGTKKAQIIADTLLTAGRNYLFPDEGSTGDVNSAFVLHKTKDNIIVKSGLPSANLGLIPATPHVGMQATDNAASNPNTATYQEDRAIFYRNGVLKGMIYQDGSGSGIKLYMGSLNGTLNYGTLEADNLTGARTWKLPDASGTLALAGAAGTLSDVLAAGNTANNDIILDDGSGNQLKMQNSLNRFYATDGTQVSIFGKLGGHQVIFLSNDAGSGEAVILATNVTTGRNFYFDDLAGNIAVRQNGGNYTAASVTGSDIVITHGMPFTPTRIFLTARASATASAMATGHYISAIGSSSFTVTFVVPLSATAINLDFNCN